MSLSASRHTVTDDEIRAALDEAAGHRAAAANILGISERALYRRISRLRATDPVPEPVPDGHDVRGVSTLYDGDGNVSARWVKTQQARADKEQALIQAVKDALADTPPAKTVPQPRRKPTDQLTCYVMGDPHLGCYAWGREAGDDFDLDIAERQLVEATRRLVACTPPAKSALIANLGDFFHADTTENKTLKSGNILDVDTRWAKVLRTGVRVMRTCIEAALERHQSVLVINEAGNHDEHTSQLLTIALSMLFEKNRRVVFDESPADYHYHEFGSTLIGVTHGDKTKPELLGPIMATDRPAEWGRTQFRYWFTGHVHHRRVFELPGCTVESFRTLAAKDAWTASSGYRSGRDMQAIIIDRKYGEVERHRCDVSRLGA